MQIAEWLYQTATILFFIGGLCGIAYLTFSILEDTQAHKQLVKFEEDFISAVKTSQPSIEQILQIARTRYIQNSAVYRVLQRQLRELLTGRASTLIEHKALIEGYIAKMNDAEPFEGMPSEIRIHLERLREQAPDKVALLEPLTAKIRELLSINEKEQRQQKLYTVWGFFLGVVGLLFAALTYFYPPNVPAHQALVRESAATNAVKLQACGCLDKN